MGETIGEARSSCQQAYSVPNIPFSVLLPCLLVRADEVIE